MKTAYQCYSNGEYVGPMEVSSDILPNGATWVAPPDAKEGFARFFRNGQWVQVEDHRKEEGYVDGERFTIHEVGPYPAGWSKEPPAPTTEELFERLRAARDGRLDASDWVMLPDVSVANKDAWVVYRQALRDLPSQTGAPWDGGGEQTPWPSEPAA